MDANFFYLTYQRENQTQLLNYTTAVGWKGACNKNWKPWK